MAEIVRANIERDFPGTYHSEEHFDNSDFTGGADLIERRYKNIAGTVKTEKEARQEFGKLLHAIQDFYSHSNYVDAYICSVNPGIEGMDKMKMIGKIPLWDRKSVGSHKELVPNPRSDNPLEIPGAREITVDDYKAFGFPLFSGTYPSEKPEKISHENLNKDFDASTSIAPEDRIGSSLVGIGTVRGRIRLATGETLHKVARDVAERQTTAEFERFFTEAKKNPNLKDVDVLK